MNWKRGRQQRRAALGVRRPRVSRIRPGSLPGTLVAAESAQPPVIDVATVNRDGVAEDRVASIDDALARMTPGELTWINIDGLADPATFARLGERLGLHPLALEDVLNVPQRPKVERFDKHVFIVMRTMRLEPREGAATPATAAAIVDEQVSVFLGADWVVTIQERSDGDCFGAVRAALRQARGRVREAGADYLAYLLIDAVVDAYFPALESIGDRLAAIEGRVLDGVGARILGDLHVVRRDLLVARRALWPLREATAVLVRGEAKRFSADTCVYLRDVHDHVVQLIDLLENYRELGASLMDLHLAATSNRLNEVMKVLTVIATIFIPLTFVVGIYGMNFDDMPELHTRYGYPAVMLGMLALALAMLLWFRRRRWI